MAAVSPSERAKIVRTVQKAVPAYGGFLAEDHQKSSDTGYARDVATVVVKAGETVLFERNVDPVILNFDGLLIVRSESGVRKKMLHALRDARRAIADYNAKSRERYRSIRTLQVYPNS
jgi:hypothetical protein